ncbi:hypothetical protein IAT38_004245 [Cryptococcus sp. DSM 104549]
MSTKMDIDRPLDEIIKSRPKKNNARGGKRSGGGGGRGAAGAAGAGGARARYASDLPKGAASLPAAPVAPEAFKIIISNLPLDVTDNAIRDLMQSTVGPVRTVQLSYTANGKSTGVATIVFKNRGDAKKAHSTYHNRMIDNQRPMKVELAIDPNQAPLANRVAPAPAGRQAGGQQRGAGGAGAGGNRRGGAASAPKPRKPQPAKKTAKELDAEMADYKQTSAA